MVQGGQEVVSHVRFALFDKTLTKYSALALLDLQAARRKGSSTKKDSLILIGL